MTGLPDTREGDDTFEENLFNERIQRILGISVSALGHTHKLILVNKVEFSPFNERLLAVAMGANFGIIGNGRLYVLGVSPMPSGETMELQRVYETQDGLFDLAFSECHDQQLVSASGDGSIRLWDLSLKVRPYQQVYLNIQDLI